MLLHSSGLSPCSLFVATLLAVAISCSSTDAATATNSSDLDVRLKSPVVGLTLSYRATHSVGRRLPLVPAGAEAEVAAWEATPVMQRLGSWMKGLVSSEKEKVLRKNAAVDKLSALKKIEDFERIKANQETSDNAFKHLSDGRDITPEAFVGWFKSVESLCPTSAEFETVIKTTLASSKIDDKKLYSLAEQNLETEALIRVYLQDKWRGKRKTVGDVVKLLELKAKDVTSGPRLYLLQSYSDGIHGQQSVRDQQVYNSILPLFDDQKAFSDAIGKAFPAERNKFPMQSILERLQALSAEKPL